MGALDDAALRKMGLPWSKDLVERTLAEVAGTILTADLVGLYKLTSVYPYVD